MWSQTEQDGRGRRETREPLVIAVEQDEMAFAIALFYAATRGQVPLPAAQSADVALRSVPPVDRSAYDDLERLSEQQDAGLDKISLTAAIAVIWHHYEGAHHRQAICSRLVAFYSLMLRSQGAITEGQSHSVDEDPTSILLEPAIIRAVATAPLTEEGQFQDAAFRRLVMEASDPADVAASAALSPQTPRLELAAPVTNIVQNLVELLYACESTVALAEPSYFRVFEKLCQPFRAVSGGPTLQPLLLRALVKTRSRYRWLASAQVSERGRVEGLDTAFLDQHPHEALQAELALMGALVQLLRSLLGDEVTLHLLRSVWPLAFLGSTASSAPSL